MSIALTTTLLCPIVIGRTDYLAAIEEHLARAAAGHGTTLLLAGEAGIGKSRLLKEARSLAIARGARVLQGNCFETDRMLPYAPLLDLLRGFCALYSRHEVSSMLRPYATELLLLLPELSSLCPEITPVVGEDAEQEKRRLFQTLTRFFYDLHTGSIHTNDLQTHEPAKSLVIILEDLHWCDDSTFEFLLFFARHLATQPILLLLSYRHEEVTGALHQFLAALDRARIVAELQLAHLQRNNTQEMISSIFNQPIRQEFADKIHDLTEGNPFFIEETLKALVATGDIYYQDGQWTRKAIQELQIPRTVQVAVAQRVSQLSSASRNVLTLAAVAGRRFDFSLLQAITGHSELELVRLVKELLAAQLVIEESADTFTFRHALTQQAIYSELLLRERRLLHKSIAESLESLHSDALENRVAELSFHYSCANDLSVDSDAASSAEVAAKTYLYARRAGERARSLHAPRAAVEHFTRAVNATRRAPITSVPESGDLLRKRGQAYEQLGEFEQARSDYEAFRNVAQSLGEPQAIWQALIDLGMLWAQRDFSLAGEHFQQALKIARTMGNSTMLAHTLKRLGNWHMNVEHVQEAVQHLNEALGIFEELNDKQGMAETLDLLGIAHFSSSNAIEGASCYERAITLFRELGNQEGELAVWLVYAPRHSVYVNNAATWPAVSFADRERDGEYALQMARQLGAKPAETLGLIWLGNGLGTGGDYGRALQCTQEGLVLAEQIEHLHFIATGEMILGTIYWDMLLLPEAQKHLEQALTMARASHSLIWLGCIVGYLTSTLVQRGKLAEAESNLEAMWNPELAMASHGQRQLWCGRAELALARHQAAEALQIVERLISTDHQVGVGGAHAVPRLAYLRGIALTMLGRYAEAESTLLAATLLAQDARPFLWRLYLALGNCYRRQNRRDDADQVYASARAVLAQLADTLTDEKIRSRFVTETNAQFPAPTEKQAAKQAFAGLTAKERVVATLIAQGQSNKEIAEVMVISHRTVESHVSNLLSKLQFTSRAQIALWVLDKGLHEL